MQQTDLEHCRLYNLYKITTYYVTLKTRITTAFLKHPRVNVVNRFEVVVVFKFELRATGDWLTVMLLACTSSTSTQHKTSPKKHTKDDY